MAKACITRKYFGGTEEIELEQFLRWVIQDEDEGIRIAKEVVKATEPYSYNLNTDSMSEPWYYEEFLPLNREELEEQIKEWEGDGS